MKYNYRLDFKDTRGKWHYYQFVEINSLLDYIKKHYWKYNQWSIKYIK